MTDKLDPVDGPLGDVAMLSGFWSHPVILVILKMLRSTNVDNVGYFLLRLAMGYMTMAAVLFIPLWLWLGFVVGATGSIGFLAIIAILFYFSEKG